MGAQTLQLVGPGSIDPNDTYNVTLTVLDGAGNAAAYYDGTVHFAASAGSVPSDYTFVPQTDNGAHTFSFTAPTTDSILTITASDPQNANLLASTTVYVGARAFCRKRACTGSPRIAF